MHSFSAMQQTKTIARVTLPWEDVAVPSSCVTQLSDKGSQAAARLCVTSAPWQQILSLCFPDIAIYYRNQGVHAYRALYLALKVTCAFPTCFPSCQTPTFRIIASLKLEKTSQVTLPHRKVALLPPFSPPTLTLPPPDPQAVHPQQHTSSHPHRGCASPRPGPGVGCASPGMTPVTPALPPWPGCWAHTEAVGHAAPWTLPLLGPGGHSPFSPASPVWWPRLQHCGAAGGGG